MDPRLKAFLDLIAFSEGTSTSRLTKNDGYDVVVTGENGPSIFTDYSDHPFAKGGSVRLSSTLFSSAAGRYQLLARYWRIYKVQLGLPDFSPHNQDAVALQQMRERHVTAIDDPATAITLCSNIWASFPGNTYGQHAHPIEMLVAKYNQLLNA